MTNEPPDRSWRPVPDPTLLTTQQLHRELAAQREVLESRISALKELVLEKFASTTKQIDANERLAAAFRDRISDDVGEMKTRLDRAEAGTVAEVSDRATRRLDMGQVIAIVAVVIAAISVAAFILKK